MRYTQKRIAQIFSYHCVEDKDAQFGAMRAKAFELADTILQCTPPTNDQTLAIGRVREAIMYANAALAIPAAE